MNYTKLSIRKQGEESRVWVDKGDYNHQLKFQS